MTAGPGARQLAEMFHERYKRFAPQFGYETRKETRAFDPTTPNGRLMIAVCDEILTWFDRQDTADLNAELETERMRLAGCGVAALADTPKTVAERLTRENPYWSAAYGDVCRMVDRLMELRAALKRYEDLEIHLSTGGKPDERVYTRKDVEMLVAVCRAGERAAFETTDQRLCYASGVGGMCRLPHGHSGTHEFL